MDHTAYLEALRSTAAGTEQSFDAEEFRARRQRVASAMREAGLEALLVTNPGEINYLTGYRTFEVSVHAALVFQPDFCFLQVPSIETGPAAATALVDEVAGYRWESVQSVIAPLVDQLRDCRSVGINQWGNGLRPGVLDALRTQLPNTVFHESSAVLDRVRRVKTAAELERLHESARMTMTGLEAAMADPERLPEQPARRTPRRMRHFDVPLVVEAEEEPEHGMTAVEVRASDQPGLLSKIARAFLAVGVRVHSARVATIGERVDDVFFITDSGNRPVDDETVRAVERELAHRISNPGAP
mgnify:CR=1 FL=1